MTHCQCHTNRPGMTNLCCLWFNLLVVFAFFFLKRNSYLFIFGCAGSLSLPSLALVAASRGYSSLRGTGFSLGWLLLLWSVGSRVCWLQEFWLLGSRAQAQSPWLTGLAAPQHVGSSWIRDGTYVSCFHRQILYHWATRDALHFLDFLTVSLQRAEPHVSPYSVNTNILIEFCQHYLCLIILFIMLI